MNPRDLFGEGLTIPRHENNDLHYIGEALPAPSLVTTAVSAATPAFIGGSAVPAREDHTHNLEFEVDLTNYYTKAEIDTMLDEILSGGMDMSNYYTKAEIDALDNSLATSIDNLTTIVYGNSSDISNLETVVINQDNRIVDLETGVTGGGSTVVPIEKDWSYGHLVNPSPQVFLNRYVAFRAFNIVYIEVTYVTASDLNTIIDMWANDGGTFHVIATVTINAGSLVQQYVFSSPYAIPQGTTVYPGIRAVASGSGKDITISIRGQYT